MTLPEYSVVVATYERPADLRRLLESLAAQTWPPARVIVIDAARESESSSVLDDFAGRLPLFLEPAVKPSAAVQRNQGAADVCTPLVAFIDDDAILAPDCAEKICAAFAEDAGEAIGGISARIQGLRHTAPRGLLRRYYRWQAGYEHPTWGGKLFGAALNCLPSYDEPGGELIPAEWLNSTCTFFRTPLFQREKFPEFEGYSFLEDVHLSARIGRTHGLFFHRSASFEHREAGSAFKRDGRALARMRMRHRRVVAREILRVPEPVLTWKLFLHRLFVSLHLLRARHTGWLPELLGTWS